jgi:hypothetical protein
MPTYKDLSRVSNQSCVIAYDIYGKLTDASFNIPPEYYEFERYANFQIGGHFGCNATITSQLFTTGSAQIPPPGINWTWQLRAIVTVDNGHGNTNTQTLVLASGTESNPNDPSYVSSVVEQISVTGTFSFSCDSEILYDITESQPIAGQHLNPPYTVLNQYERSLVGGTATCSVTLNGQTVTATGTIASSQTTDYNFIANVEAVSMGSLGGQEQAILSAPLINSILIPDNGYTFVRTSNQFVEATTVIKALTTGEDDVFGTQLTTIAEINADITLNRNVNCKGWVNAYNVNYPNNLTASLLNFDGGTRSVTFSGDYDENETFKKYSYVSTLTLPGQTTLNDTDTFDDIPAGNFKNSLTSASLIANGDAGFNTRMPFRAWSFPGASLYHNKYTTLSGSGNTRSFNDPNRTNFSGYRFLEINAASATSSTQTANVWISYGNSGTYVLNQTFQAGVTTANNLIDLCFAGTLHTSPTADLSSQDNPYPRANPNSSYDWASQKLINDSLYGIGQVGEVRVDGNVTVNSMKLYRDDNTAKADFCPVISNTGLGFTTVFTGSASTTYLGRRFWSQDVQGRNDEEYDILNLSGTYDPQSIAGFVDNITNLTGYQGGRVHLGWTASSSTPNDSSSNLRDGYLNEDGYLTWLNGGGMEYISGNQKYGFDRDLSEEYNDYDINAQVIFDEINCSFIPDYYDPFGIETPGETKLLLYGFNVQRGCAHGLVQLQELGETVVLQDLSLANRGSSVTDVVGRYQTGLFFGQAEKYNDVFLGAASIGTTILTAKRNRAAFYLAAPTPTGNIIKSADLSGFYQHLIAYVSSGIVNLIRTETPDFSNFIYLATDISDAVNPAVRWKTKTSQNQIILTVEMTSGDINRYILNDLSTGACDLATTLGTGTTPALAINGQGFEYHFFRVSDSGGSIRRVGIDNAGNIQIASSIVVTGNVANDGIAAYTYDSDVYLIYNDTTNGITVLRSEDSGITFS